MLLNVSLFPIKIFIIKIVFNIYFMFVVKYLKNVAKYFMIASRVDEICEHFEAK